MTSSANFSGDRSGAFRPTGTPDLIGAESDDESLQDTNEQLRGLLAAEIGGRPFTELSGVTFDHRGAELAGHVLLDTLEDAGYAVGDFDAVGALTAAAVPLADAMLHAAASRGQDLDAFVMDFVYPSIKGPSIRGKKVILLDAWLSEKSYVQTSSLVTLRKGNELNLDFGVVKREGATVVAVASLVGGVGRGADQTGRPTVDLVDPVDGTRTTRPFICAFCEDEFRPEGSDSPDPVGNRLGGPAGEGER